MSFSGFKILSMRCLLSTAGSICDGDDTLLTELLILLALLLLLLVFTLKFPFLLPSDDFEFVEAFDVVDGAPMFLEKMFPAAFKIKDALLAVSAAESATISSAARNSSKNLVNICKSSIKRVVECTMLRIC